jgi:hypothetical protein
MKKFLYVVCAWCEKEYDSEERETVAYRLNGQHDQNRKWIHLYETRHEKENSTHSICPHHIEEIMQHEMKGAGLK